MFKLTLIPHIIGTSSLIMLSPRDKYELALFILYSTIILPIILGWNNPVYTYLKSSHHHLIIRISIVTFLILNYYLIRKSQLKF